MDNERRPARGRAEEPDGFDDELLDESDELRFEGSVALDEAADPGLEPAAGGSRMLLVGAILGAAVLLLVGAGLWLRSDGGASTPTAPPAGAEVAHRAVEGAGAGGHGDARPEAEPSATAAFRPVPETAQPVEPPSGPLPSAIKVEDTAHSEAKPTSADAAHGATTDVRHSEPAEVAHTAPKPAPAPEPIPAKAAPTTKAAASPRNAEPPPASAPAAHTEPKLATVPKPPVEGRTAPATADRSSTTAPAAATAAAAPKPAPDGGSPLHDLVREGKFAQAAKAGLARAQKEAPRHALQVALVCNTDNVRRAFASVKSVELFLVPATVGGKDCYRLLWGSYTDAAAAKAARGAVPEYFVKNGGGAAPRPFALADAR